MFISLESCACCTKYHNLYNCSQATLLVASEIHASTINPNQSQSGHTVPYSMFSSHIPTRLNVGLAMSSLLLTLKAMDPQPSPRMKPSADWPSKLRVELQGLAGLWFGPVSFFQVFVLKVTLLCKVMYSNRSIESHLTGSISNKPASPGDKILHFDTF